MACGTPVVARREGGVLDSVVDGVTGVFFDGTDPRAMARAMERAETVRWNRTGIRERAAQFSREHFMREFAREIDRATGDA